jgi:hypothetical protein
MRLANPPAEAESSGLRPAESEVDVLAWLGVGPGEHLKSHCSVSTRRARARTAGWAASASGLIGGATAFVLASRQLGEKNVPFWLLMAMLVGGWAGAILLRRRRTCVWADAQGLFVRAGRWSAGVAWGDLQSIQEGNDGRSLFWDVSAGVQQFRFSDDAPGAAVIADAIARAVAANDLGWALPSRRPVSDAALSASASEADADRGLSRP